MEYKLDMHCQAIMEEYHRMKPVFEKMQEIVSEQLRQCVDENNIHVVTVETRIKTEESLAGKLELKGNKYHSLNDITDILGGRVITFYTDEVDKIAAIIEKKFIVDRENSIDKRKVLDIDRFGYMSLHYICRIPTSLYEDKEYPLINIFRFEIQMRTALQHVWAAMNHDIGYKSNVEIPANHLRNLNRIAGMLELADEQFSRIRREITDYRRQVQALVADGNFNDVPLDGDTFRSYLDINPFKMLIERISSVNQAEVYEDSLMRYLEVLLNMNMKTLGDIERLIHNYSEAAYKLALHQFAGTDLDIMAQSIALQNLCIVYIAKQGGGEKGLKAFYDLIFGESEDNSRRAKHILQQLTDNHII